MFLEIVDEITSWLAENWSVLSVTTVAVGGLVANLKEIKRKASLKSSLDKLANNSAVITTADVKILELEKKIERLEIAITKVGDIVYTGFLNSGIKNKNDLAKIWNGVEAKEVVTAVAETIQKVASIGEEATVTLEEVKKIILPKIEENPYISAAINKYGK
jgi:hypothetical protein